MGSADLENRVQKSQHCTDIMFNMKNGAGMNWDFHVKCTL